MAQRPPVDLVPFYAILALAAWLLQMAASWLASRSPGRPRLLRFARAKGWPSTSNLAIGMLLFAIAQDLTEFGPSDRSTYVGLAALAGLAASVLDRTRGRPGDCPAFNHPGGPAGPPGSFFLSIGGRRGDRSTRPRRRGESWAVDHSGEVPRPSCRTEGLMPGVRPYIPADRPEDGGKADRGGQHRRRKGVPTDRYDDYRPIRRGGLGRGHVPRGSVHLGVLVAHPGDEHPEPHQPIVRKPSRNL